MRQAGRAFDRSTPLRSHYGATVALVCLSTCSGLLLTTVFDLLSRVAPFVQAGGAERSLQTLRQALTAAEHDVFRLVAIGVEVALAFMAALYLGARIRPHPPRLDSYIEQGEPAVGER